MDQSVNRKEGRVPIAGEIRHYIDKGFGIKPIVIGAF